MGPDLSWLASHYVLDAWSLVHLLAWLLFARLTVEFGLLRRSRAVLAALVLGLAWELVEQETGVLGSSGEPPLNRWVADPLLNLLGAYLGAELGLFYRSLPIFRDIILTAADQIKRERGTSRPASSRN